MKRRQPDNRGLAEKLRLRREALARLGHPPTVCETHVGFGVIGQRLYRDLPRGVAIDKHPEKAVTVAEARPGWRVYRGDSAAALSGGLAGDLRIDFLDVDPYGDPWPTVKAFLLSPREKAPRLVIAVNDGLRKGLQIGFGWRYGSLADAVLHFGSELFPVYLAAARWMLEREGRRGGYRLAEFRGFYGGRQKKMSHYFGVLEWDPVLVPEVEEIRSGRPSFSARGYGPGWEAKRRAQIRREPWCRHCVAAGRAKVKATDVDHVVPKPEGSDDPENLQSLCHSCHSRKTASEAQTLPFAAERRRRADREA